MKTPFRLGFCPVSTFNDLNPFYSKSKKFAPILLKFKLEAHHIYQQTDCSRLCLLSRAEKSPEMLLIQSRVFVFCQMLFVSISLSSTGVIILCRYESSHNQSIIFTCVWVLLLRYTVTCATRYFS